MRFLRMPLALYCAKLMTIALIDSAVPLWDKISPKIGTKTKMYELGIIKTKGTIFPLES